jgi:hypothetical protein
MLSLAPVAEPGRRIVGSGGLHSANVAVPLGVAGAVASVALSGASQSELSPSVMLTAQVQGGDRWLQIDHALFHAEDFYGPFSTSFDQTLTIKGTVHR